MQINQWSWVHNHRLTGLFAVLETGIRLVVIFVEQPKGLLHHVDGPLPLPLGVALQARGPDVLEAHVLTQRVAILWERREEGRMVDESSWDEQHKGVGMSNT